jgi:HSP20 family protein
MALPTRVNRGQQAYDPADYAQREFDYMLNRWFGGRGSDGGTALAPYGVDVREDQDHLYVEAELPGFRKDDVDITLENQTLTITAERSDSNGRGGNGNGNPAGEGQPARAGGQQQQPQQQPQARPQGDWLLRERRYTRFQRSFTLPPTVDESSVHAKLADGVLTITLNKREETKPRKIQVG